MKRMTKIAGLGLLTGAAVTLVAPIAAVAHDGGPRMGEQKGRMGFEGPRVERTFADFDTNGDGLITEEDFTLAAQERFEGADADGDGSVTLDELAASIEANMKERFADAEDDARIPSDKQVAARAERMAQHMIDRADADENGTLEAEEMLPKEGFARMIDRFDTDDDNALSEEEFDEMQKERHARMEHRGEDGRFGERGPKRDDH